MTDNPAPDSRDVAVLREELARLREEAHHLRAQVRTRPLISHAQGILEERYRLPDGEAAFALLRSASQHHNVKLRVLAEAVTRSPRPEGRGTTWFSGPSTQPPPSLESIGLAATDNADRATVLSGVLSQTLAVVGAGMGNVQIADPAAEGLRIVQHTGLNARFVEHFAVVSDGTTSCARAAEEAALTTVHDVATDPAFSEPDRRAILLAGSRACHSIPLVDEDGSCVGVVSAHLARPTADLHPAQVKALDSVGHEVGRWLGWQERGVLREALEHLHVLGRRSLGGGS
ncbi:ANTAR domain-containing protein [Streptomyces xanthochromogenes]|uniref:ANTAR domain-containing protein n=1 Tax=Streptomyces xanthochromogenes TaxID=67384 RepID=UPI0034300EFA